MNLPSRVEVHLLNGDVLDISLTPRLGVNELLLLVSNHCNIQSPDIKYFGISYVDEKDNIHWLNNDSQITDSIFYSHKRIFSLRQNVRYFADSIFSVEHSNTVEWLFLEASQQLVKGHLDVSDSDRVELSSYLLHIYANDYKKEHTVEEYFRPPFPSLPQSKKMNKIEYRQRIIDKYSSLNGMERGTALIRFMEIVECCSTYGTRFYPVTENGNSYIMGINSKGIYIYHVKQLFQAKQVFLWKFLDNLYYKDKSFSIEVRDSRRIVQSSGDLNSFLDSSMRDDDELSKAVNDPTTQVSLSRRSVSVPSIRLHTFHCDSSILCKTIWETSIAQHQFFLEQKNTKRTRPTTGVDHRELSEKLNRLVSKSSIGSSLPSLSSLHSSSSLGTMPSAKVGDLSVPTTPSAAQKKIITVKTDEDRKKDKEIYKQLRHKRSQIEEKLKKKMSELKAICIIEGELTGQMPSEMRFALYPGEDEPKLKMRIGTAFTISSDLLHADKKGDKMNSMETDVELHRKIVAAAERLAKDKTMNKSVRKKRQKDLQAASLKLRGLEHGLNQMRLSASKPDVSSLGSNNSANSWTSMPGSSQPLTRVIAKSCPTTPRGSVPDLCQTDGEKSEYEDEEMMQRAPSWSSPLATQHLSHSSSSTSIHPRRSFTQTSLTSDELDNPLTMIASPTNIPLYENVGYRSTSYRSSYRQAHYPTIQDDERLRKRAQSAHTLSNGDMNGRNHQINGEIDMIEKTMDEDKTPTVENPQPMRRMTTSVSCQEGFSTASLDRRAMKNSATRQAAVPIPILNESSSHREATRGHSPSTHRITTFPVSHHTSKPYSSSDLPRFPSPSQRIPHLPSRSSLPHYNHLIRSSPSNHHPSSSNSKLSIHSHTDPHMEALLDYYKETTTSNRKAQQPAKTATIV